MEGESLVNDAASLTVFRFALVAVISGTLLSERAATAFVMVTVMGIFIGLVLAQIMFYIYRIIFHHHRNCYCTHADHALYHVSDRGTFSLFRRTGCGEWRSLLSSRSKEILNHKARLQSAGVWHTLASI